MRAEYIRIYSEEELHRKVQQTSAMLLVMKQKIADNSKFCDIDALRDMWIQYESTRFIVTESFPLDYLEDDEYSCLPDGLYVQREVDDDYSDDLQDPDSLHNGLVSLQFIYDSIQALLNEQSTIDCSRYIDMRSLVLNLAADIYRHLEPCEYDHYLRILDNLNWRYLKDVYHNGVLEYDVVSYILAKKDKTQAALDNLITTLGLVAE